jgi:hypothetical protein
MTWKAGVRRDWNRFLGRERGKCSYGPNHESVRRVGDFWLGESTNDFACPLAPAAVCPKCKGACRVPLTSQELALDPESTVKDKQCEPCHGQGMVPGPHWPWRKDHPGSLPLELLS